MLSEMVPKLQQGGVLFQHVRNFHFYFVAQGLALLKTENRKASWSGQRVIQSENLDLASPPLPSFFGPVGPFGISDLELVKQMAGLFPVRLSGSNSSRHSHKASC